MDEDFAEHERLFHYTSSQGLFGILESNCLWATHFKFLNDSKEFFAAKKSLTEFVEIEIRRKIAAFKVNNRASLPKGVALRDLSLSEAEKIVDILYQVTLDMGTPFVFSSFVADSGNRNYRNGELLHWATYGRNGGYAIEINPHKLFSLITQHSQSYDSALISKRAVYVEDKVPDELKRDYAEIARVAQNLLEGIIEDRSGDIDPIDAAAPFMRIASVIKDGYFKSEKESRLVALRFNRKHEQQEKANEKICIRHGPMGAVPYIKLFDGILLGENCPIEAIVVGPHPDRERRVEALSIFLESHGLSDVAVIPSEVPYLGA